MKKYYYARLNDNNICIEVVARVEELRDVTGYIKLPEYNESYYYKEYLGNGTWSQETYYPNIDTMLQDKVESFEGLVNRLTNENTQLSNQVITLNGNVTQLEGTIMELTTMLAMLQGGN